MSLVLVACVITNSELVRKYENTLVLYIYIFLVAFFAGDPLYAVGGQPKCLDCDFMDESFAEDG